MAKEYILGETIWKWIVKGLLGDKEAAEKALREINSISDLSEK